MARSPAEFWRRWHITLSSWLRDYLYYPLGGSRRGPVRTYWNLWLTMFLIGMWHGASLNFVIYGNLHAFAMVLHRFAYKRSGRGRDARDPPLVYAAKILLCLHFVVFSRILFRAPDLHSAAAVTEQLFAGGTSTAQVSVGVWIVLLASFCAHYTPSRWFAGLQRFFIASPAPAQGIALAAAAALATYMNTGDVVPYIYYQF